MKLEKTFAATALILLVGCNQTNSTSQTERQQASYNDALDCAAFTSLALGIDARKRGTQDTPLRIILAEAHRNATGDAGEKSTSAGLSISDSIQEITSRSIFYADDTSKIIEQAGICTDIFASEESKRVFKASLSPTSP